MGWFKFWINYIASLDHYAELDHIKHSLNYYHYFTNAIITNTNNDSSSDDENRIINTLSSSLITLYHHNHNSNLHNYQQVHSFIIKLVVVTLNNTNNNNNTIDNNTVFNTIVQEVYICPTQACNILSLFYLYSNKMCGLILFLLLLSYTTIIILTFFTIKRGFVFAVNRIRNGIVWQNIRRNGDGVSQVQGQSQGQGQCQCQCQCQDQVQAHDQANQSDVYIPIRGPRKKNDLQVTVNILNQNKDKDNFFNLYNNVWKKFNNQVQSMIKTKHQFNISYYKAPTMVHLSKSLTKHDKKIVSTNIYLIPSRPTNINDEMKFIETHSFEGRKFHNSTAHTCTKLALTLNDNVQRINIIPQIVSQTNEMSSPDGGGNDDDDNDHHHLDGPSLPNQPFLYPINSELPSKRSQEHHHDHHYRYRSSPATPSPLSSNRSNSLDTESIKYLLDLDHQSLYYSEGKSTVMSATLPQMVLVPFAYELGSGAVDEYKRKPIPVPIQMIDNNNNGPEGEDQDVGKKKTVLIKPFESSSESDPEDE